MAPVSPIGRRRLRNVHEPLFPRRISRTRCSLVSFGGHGVGASEGWDDGQFDPPTGRAMANPTLSGESAGATACKAFQNLRQHCGHSTGLFEGPSDTVLARLTDLKLLSASLSAINNLVADGIVRGPAGTASGRSHPTGSIPTLETFGCERQWCRRGRLSR